MKNLKLLREEHQESQYDLADSLDISQTAIQQYEKGKRGKKLIDTLCMIADYYSVSIDFLVGRTEIRSSLNSADDKLASRIHHLNTPRMRDAALILLEEMEKIMQENKGNPTKK